MAWKLQMNALEMDVHMQIYVFTSTLAVFLKHLKCFVQRVFDEVISRAIWLKPTCNPEQMEWELLPADLN